MEIEYVDGSSENHGHEKYCLRKNGTQHSILTCIELQEQTILDMISDIYPYRNYNEEMHFQSEN